MTRSILADVNLHSSPTSSTNAHCPLPSRCGIASWVCLLLLAAPSAHAVDAFRLKTSLVEALSAQYKTAPATNLARIASRVALRCQGATNNLDLYELLKPALVSREITGEPSPILAEDADTIAFGVSARVLADGSPPIVVSISPEKPASKRDAPPQTVPETKAGVTTNGTVTAPPEFWMIYGILTNRYPMLNPAHAGSVAGGLATKQSSTSSGDAFYHNAKTFLQDMVKQQELGIPDADTDSLAMLITARAYPNWVSGGKSSVALTKTNPIYAGLSIMAGLVTLNPFTVRSNAAGYYELTPNNSSTRFMVQANYMDRWAWNIPTNTSYMEWCFAGSSNRWDIQARGAFTFADDSEDTSTILGSGDLCLEASVGRHLWRWSDGHKAGSFNLEVGLSSVTDRQFADTHATVIFGPAYVASFAPPWNSEGTRAFFLLRGGGAYYQVPQLPDVGSALVSQRHGFPEYDCVLGYGVEMEMAYPLSKNLFLSAGGRVYGGSDPNPWTVFIGASMSLDAVTTWAKDPFK